MAAANSTVSLFVSLVVLFLTSVMAQPGEFCGRPTENDVFSVLDDHIRYVAAVVDDIELTIWHFAPTCLSVSDKRDNYKDASIAVMFLSNQDYFDCNANYNCTGYLHLSCSNDTWVRPDSSTPTFDYDFDALVNVQEPRIDCGTCSSLGALSPDFDHLYDATTHCYECNNGGCDGLGYCQGINLCCSFYNGETCTPECEEGNFANEYTNFVCTECITESSSCHNNGFVSDPTSCMCNCTNTNYHGVVCDIDNNECEDNPDICQHGGQCINTEGDYSCSCTGYSGKNCEYDINECEDNPGICQHGGQCMNTEGDYSCNCHGTGYSGKNCEYEINECDTNPCVHGQCVDGSNSYTCTCDAGYTGDNCDLDINECEDSPCRNGGTCVDEINGYSCQCTEGYFGVDCGDFDYCTPNPCMNGGQCILNPITDYTCFCSIDYRGQRCEVYVANCIEFSKENDSCNRCSDRNTLVNGVCVQCGIKYCLECETDNVCSACSSGLVPNVDGDACVEPIRDSVNMPETTLQSSIIAGIGVSIVVAVVLLVSLVVVAVTVSFLYHKSRIDGGDKKNKRDKDIEHSQSSLV